MLRVIKPEAGEDPQVFDRAHQALRPVIIPEDREREEMIDMQPFLNKQSQREFDSVAALMLQGWSGF